MVNLSRQSNQISISDSLIDWIYIGVVGNSVSTVPAPNIFVT